jgi:hypothetical protein
MRVIEAKSVSGYGGLRQTEFPKPQPTTAKARVAAAGFTPLESRSCRLDILEPRRRWCSAMRAWVSSRTRAKPCVI